MNIPIQNIKVFNRTLIAVILFYICLGSYIYIKKPTPIPLKSDLNNMPILIQNWTGKRIDLLQTPFRTPGADSEVGLIYSDSSGEEIKLYVGYYESQKQGKELIQYIVNRLYRDSEVIDIQIETDNSIRVNKSIIRGRIQTNQVLFFYILNGRIVNNKYIAKLITAFYGIIHNNTSGSIIIVSSLLDNSKDADSVLEKEIEFVKAVYPVLTSYFPYTKAASY